jgi:hypothetical protein
VTNARVSLVAALLIATSSACAEIAPGSRFVADGVQTVVIAGVRDHVAVRFEVHLSQGSAKLELVDRAGLRVQLAQLGAPRDIDTTSEASGTRGTWMLRWTTIGAVGTYRLSWAEQAGSS